MQNAGGIAGKGSAIGMGRLGVGAAGEFAVSADGNSCGEFCERFCFRVRHRGRMRTSMPSLIRLVCKAVRRLARVACGTALAGRPMPARVIWFCLSPRGMTMKTKRALFSLCLCFCSQWRFAIPRPTFQQNGRSLPAPTSSRPFISRKGFACCPSASSRNTGRTCRWEPTCSMCASRC